LHDLFAPRPRKPDCNCISGDVKPDQPSAIGLLAGLEAIDDFFEQRAVRQE
jgi:hypothetical protein